MSEDTIVISRALYNDLRALFRAARGVRNTMHDLTRDDVQPCDWAFAKEARNIFRTLGSLTSVVTLIEAKMFAPEDRCPSCGAEL